MEPIVESSLPLFLHVTRLRSGKERGVVTGPSGAAHWNRTRYGRRAGRGHCSETQSSSDTAVQQTECGVRLHTIHHN